MKPQKFISIGKKLLFSILLVSSIFTAVVTLISFYVDYRNELGLLDATFTYIERTAVPNASKSVWELNEKDIKSQITGILDIEDIVAGKVLDETGKVIFEDRKKGSVHYRKFTNRTYDLTYKQGDKVQKIGSLQVTATKDNMNARLVSKVFYFFFSQGLKTLVVSFILLMIFRALVIRHLSTISSFFGRYNIQESEKEQNLSLDRKYDHYDEFDVLITSVNEMAEVVRLHNKASKKTLKEKEEELKFQKALAYNSAKLAALGEMSGSIAHEINNPLMIISGYTGLVKKLSDTGDPKKSREIDDYCDKIELTIERIVRIIQGLRRLSRDVEDEPFSKVEVKDLLDEVSLLSFQKMKNHGITVEVLMDEATKHKTVECRSVQISQVLINLLNNAFDAVIDMETPWIRIECKEKGNNVQIRVTDSGQKIDKEVRKNIMTPFFTTKPAGKGTGLGLSISKRILEEHAGQLYLEESAENTQFVIDIPMKQAS